MPTSRPPAGVLGFLLLSALWSGVESAATDEPAAKPPTLSLETAVAAAIAT